MNSWEVSSLAPGMSVRKKIWAVWEQTTWRSFSWLRMVDWYFMAAWIARALVAGSPVAQDVWMSERLVSQNACKSRMVLLRQ